jgi:hypothetical protein
MHTARDDDPELLLCQALALMRARSNHACFIVVLEVRLRRHESSVRSSRASVNEPVRTRPVHGA